MKSPSGKVVAVKAIDLSVGDTEVYFEFVTEIAGDLEAGTWTVAGVEYDYAAELAVKAVNDASTQIQLLTALNSPYFTNVVEDNIVEYWNKRANLTSTPETVADVQEKLIDAANKTVTQNAQVEDILKAAQANNQVALLSRLKAANFDRILDVNIADLTVTTPDVDGYLTAIEALGAWNAALPVSADTIQAEIDAVNLDIAEAYAAETNDNSDVSIVRQSLTRADYNKALTQVNNLDEEDQETEKEDLLKALNITDLLIKLKEAQTNAAMGTALTNLAAESTSLDVDTVLSSNSKAYRDALNASGVSVTDRNGVSDIQTLVNNTNAAELIKVVDKFVADADGLDETKATDRTTFINLLKQLDAKSAKADFDYSEDIDEKITHLYMVAIQADFDSEDAGGVPDSTIHAAHTVADASTADATLVAIKTVLDATTTASESTALTVVQNLDPSTVTANELYNALTDPALGLSNVLSSNREAYKKDASALVTAAGTSKVALQSAINATNGLVSFNSATTASAAATGLATVAVAEGITDFIDFTSTGRLDIAQLVLDIRPNGGFNTVAALVNELGADDTATTATIGNFKASSTDSALKVYTEVLAEVNAAGPDNASISGLVTALNKLNYKAFKDLSALEKANVAETVIEDWAKTGDPATQVNFRTWAAVRNAVDAAIAKQ